MRPWVNCGKKISMPGRKVALVNNEIYHVINRGVASQPTFLTEKDYRRALNSFLYYQNQNLSLGYSHFIVQSRERKAEILKQLKLRKKILVEIITFCFMPNHFHCLLKQVVDNGISKFLSDFTNSYTRYFNTKSQRQGPLFQGKFKAVRIETDEQLLHTNRYIHLNPYTSYVVKTLKQLENYPYSSFPEYLGKTKANFCHKKLILNNFKTIKTYQEFVFNQADYQRRLEEIKHLILE